jgi:hypothetical protein
MKIVQLPTNGGTVLDASVAVIASASPVERIMTTGLLQSAMGGPGDASQVLTNINGITMPVSNELQQLIQTCRNNRPVVFEISALDVEIALDQPGEAALYSAIYLYALLGEQTPTPVPLGTPGKIRLSILREKRQGGHKVDDQLMRAIVELEAWRTNLVSGYSRVDAAQAAVAEAEEAANKKFAGPSAFNKFADLREARDKTIQSIGFADFETFVRERTNLLNTANQRLHELHSAVDAATAGWPGEPAETTILELHRDVDAKLGRSSAYGVDAGSARSKNVLRHNIASATTQILNAMGLETSNDRSIADAQLVFERMMKEADSGRHEQLQRIAEYLARLSAPSDVGPLPLVVTGGALGLIGGSASSQLGILLRSARQNDQQIIFVEAAEVADKVREELAAHESAASYV